MRLEPEATFCMKSLLESFLLRERKCLHTVRGKRGANRSYLCAAADTL